MMPNMSWINVMIVSMLLTAVQSFNGEGDSLNFKFRRKREAQEEGQSGVEFSYKLPESSYAYFQMKGERGDGAGFSLQDTGYKVPVEIHNPNKNRKSRFGAPSFDPSYKDPNIPDTFRPSENSFHIPDVNSLRPLENSFQIPESNSFGPPDSHSFRPLPSPFQIPDSNSFTPPVSSFRIPGVKFEEFTPETTTPVSPLRRPKVFKNPFAKPEERPETSEPFSFVDSNLSEKPFSVFPGNPVRYQRPLLAVRKVLRRKKNPEETSEPYSGTPGMMKFHNQIKNQLKFNGKPEIPFRFEEPEESPDYEIYKEAGNYEIAKEPEVLIEKPASQEIVHETPIEITYEIAEKPIRHKKFRPNRQRKRQKQFGFPALLFPDQELNFRTKFRIPKQPLRRPFRPNNRNIKNNKRPKRQKVQKVKFVTTQNFEEVESEKPKTETYESEDFLNDDEFTEILPDDEKFALIESELLNDDSGKVKFVINKSPYRNDFSHLKDLPEAEPEFKTADPVKQGRKVIEYGFRPTFSPSLRNRNQVLHVIHKPGTKYLLPKVIANKNRKPKLLKRNFIRPLRLIDRNDFGFRPILNKRLKMIDRLDDESKSILKLLPLKSGNRLRNDQLDFEYFAERLIGNKLSDIQKQSWWTKKPDMCPGPEQNEILENSDFNKCQDKLSKCHKNPKDEFSTLTHFGTCLVDKYPEIRDLSITSPFSDSELAEKFSEIDTGKGDMDCTKLVHIFFRDCRTLIPSCSRVRTSLGTALPVLGCLFSRYPEIMIPLLTDPE